jgi:hypothetical protein
LARAAQASGTGVPRPFGDGGFGLPALLALLLPLAACGGGVDLDRVDVDPTVLTSDVPAAPRNADATRASDEATIRNAVSSADVEGLRGGMVPWANSDTGSRGTISKLTEYRDSGMLCRGFTASRESFDGVRLYQGSACMAAAGAWRIEALKVL